MKDKTKIDELLNAAQSLIDKYDDLNMRVTRLDRQFKDIGIDSGLRYCDSANMLDQGIRSLIKRLNEEGELDV